MSAFETLLDIDPILLIPGVMVMGAAFLAIQAIMGLAMQAQTQRIVNRRLQFKEKFESTNEAMVELRKSRGLDADGNFATTLLWLNRLVVRSGLPFQPWRWAAMAGCFSVFVGALIVYAGANVWIGVAVGFPVFVVAPIVAFTVLAKKRVKKLAEQLPDALQIVCRSLEAGHPVATAVALVAREMPDPIGSEFGMAADEVSYGMSLTAAVQRMAERGGDPDVELFAATVRLQEKTGGNLCELLKANTSTVRERQTMRLKVRAASAEGRTSAMILTAAPFMVGGAIHLLRPEFYGTVVHDPLIKYGFSGLFVWMIIGNVVMNRMINFKA